MKAHGFMAITRCAMPDRNINVLMPAVACTHTHAAHSAAERARVGTGARALTARLPPSHLNVEFTRARTGSDHVSWAPPTDI
jgi:hypothetical protein